MKKIILAFVIMFFAAPAFAQCDYPTKCAPSGKNYHKISEFFENATGTRTLAKSVVERFINNNLEKATGHKFTSNIDFLTVGELAQGKFTSLSIEGSNVTINGIYFSDIKLKTVCENNHIDVFSTPIKNKENMVINFSVEMSDTDLKNSLTVGGYSKMIQSADLKTIGIASYKIYPETVAIQNGQLFFSMNATPVLPLVPVDISVGANVKAQDGNLTASQINFINLVTNFNLDQFPEIMKNLRTLKYPLKIPGYNGAEIQVLNFYLHENMLHADGMIFIPKSS